MFTCSVALEAKPATLVERIIDREPESWSGLLELVEHAQELAASMPALRGVDLVVSTVGHAPNGGATHPRAPPEHVCSRRRQSDRHRADKAVARHSVQRRWHAGSRTGAIRRRQCSAAMLPRSPHRMAIAVAVIVTAALVWLSATLQINVAQTRGERLEAVDQLLLATLREEFQLRTDAERGLDERVRTALEARSDYRDAIRAVESETEGVDEVVEALDDFTSLHDRWEQLADARSRGGCPRVVDQRTSLVDRDGARHRRLRTAVADEQDEDQAGLTLLLIGLSAGLFLVVGGVAPSSRAAASASAAPSTRPRRTMSPPRASSPRRCSCSATSRRPTSSSSATSSARCPPPPRRSSAATTAPTGSRRPPSRRPRPRSPSGSPRASSRAPAWPPASASSRSARRARSRCCPATSAAPSRVRPPARRCWSAAR